MKWDLYLNFLAAMLAIVNPIGIWPIWSELTNDSRSSKVRRHTATLLVLTSFGILLVFLFSGQYILKFFSIDLPVFKIGGGIMLLLSGISMIQGQASQIESREEAGDTDLNLAKQRFKKIIVPLVIPALAGPGSITTVILYSSRLNEMIDYVMLAAVVLVALIALWIVFINSSFLERRVDSVVFTVFTRIFGIIVVAIAIQFIVEGLGDVFPNWMEGASELEKGKNKP